jgi:hypothetical protein
MRGLAFVLKQLRNARILAFGYDPQSSYLEIA